MQAASLVTQVALSEADRIEEENCSPGLGKRNGMLQSNVGPRAKVGSMIYSSISVAKLKGNLIGMLRLAQTKVDCVLQLRSKYYTRKPKTAREPLVAVFIEENGQALGSVPHLSENLVGLR